MFDTVRAMRRNQPQVLTVINTTAQLAMYYRNQCREQLALCLSLLRHPSAGMRARPGISHQISLPDGHQAEIHLRRHKLPAGATEKLARHHAEYLLLADEPLFLFSVIVRIDGGSEVVEVGPGGLNRNDTLQRRRARATAQALHPESASLHIFDDGTDPRLRGYRFSWIGSREAYPLPCPKELFSPRLSAA